jgi:sugar phosphate isomerase/epimerase
MRQLDRRRFLQVAGAGALSLALPGQGRAETRPDPFGGFTLGVQSYTFRNFDLEPCLKRIKDLGLTSVEFYQKHAPLEARPEQLAAILKLCKEYGVTPRCWGVQNFKKDHDFNKKIFEFGKALGVAAFSADPDPDSFDSLDKLCEEYKIAIAIHPHGPAGGGKLHRWYGSEVILPAVKDHNALIGTCLDTGHLIRADQLNKKLDPATEIRAMGKRNFGIHLKDHDNAKKTDVIIGKGVLDVPGVIKALREVGFKYMISIEYEANPNEPTEDVRACVEVFKKAATA